MARPSQWQTKGQRRSATRLSMSFGGILTDAELLRLDQQFGTLHVCPGYTGEFGKFADECGKLYVPGAATSHSESCQIFRGWVQRGQNQKYDWWPAKLEAAGVSPIRASDIIAGLDLKRWQEYSQLYKRGMAARAQARHRDKRSAAAQEVKENITLRTGAAGSTEAPAVSTSSAMASSAPGLSALAYVCFSEGQSPSKSNDSSNSTPEDFDDSGASRRDSRTSDSVRSSANPSGVMQEGVQTPEEDSEYASSQAGSAFESQPFFPFQWRHATVQMQ